MDTTMEIPQRRLLRCSLRKQPHIAVIPSCLQCCLLSHLNADKYLTKSKKMQYGLLPHCQGQGLQDTLDALSS